MNKKRNVWTEEQKKNISQKVKLYGELHPERYKSEEYKNRIREAHLGKKYAPMSEERKKKLSVDRMGVGNPMYGRKLTQEQKDARSKLFKNRKITWGDKISKALKGKPAGHNKLKEYTKLLKGKSYEEIYGYKKSLEIKEKISKGNFGKKRSDDIKKKFSEIQKKSYKNLSKEEKIKRAKTCNDAVSKNLHGDGTSIERKVRDSLKNRISIQYKKVFVLNNKLFIPDIYIPKYKLIIECDGVYWHNYPYGLERDKIKDKYFKENGYNVLRLWEHDINKMSKDEIYKYILNYIHQLHL